MFALLKKFWNRPRYTAFGRTDTGMVRDHNEDSFAVLADLGLYLVADGMGGHNAGEVASRLAIETLIDYFTPARIRQMRGRDEETRHSLITGLHRANRAVMDAAEYEPSYRGMGCTLVACRLDGATLHTCHVGDARCYVADRTGITQVTTDHTGMTYQPQGDAERPRSRPVVTMAIGFAFQQDPEYHRLTLRPGQQVLLCSDGLWSMVADAELHTILMDAASPEEACATLVERANAAGGRDNITALVVAPR
ncbi:MAG TPA: protein phosphatase 2C domain-containing protein [Desulfurivibrionaceae bacterium]|nr:protein phosphatase 2C domain-containing protein [Desulfurivibrionaceae bacterium]